MGLEIASIERSRPVDSQAWCFFFSARPRRKVMTSQSRVILGKSRIFYDFVLEIQSVLNRECLLTSFLLFWEQFFCGRDSGSTCHSMMPGPFLNGQARNLLQPKK